jgi:hypothetical protein
MDRNPGQQVLWYGELGIIESGTQELRKKTEKMCGRKTMEEG